MFCATREVLSEVEKMRGHEVTRILRQFAEREGLNQLHNRAHTDQGKSQPANAFHNPVSTFQQNADLKDLMDAMFIYGS